MSGGPIELEIEQIVVSGVEPTDRDALVCAVELELERLLEQRGVPDTASTSSASTPVMLELQHSATAGGGESVGAQIARAIYGALAR